MPLYDFLCSACEQVHEAITPMNQDKKKCPDCGSMAKKIISGSHREQDDSKWIRSILDVVDKESKDPHTREFLKRPTRENYKNWMKATGLRHFEPGEERQRPPAPDLDKINKETWNRLQERRRIEVR